MLRAVKSDFVAVGTFNIYVLQPDWFTLVGLFDEEQEISVQTDLTRPGYRFVPEGSPIEWTVSPEKVSATSRSLEADCGEAVFRVIETLEWTPLLAVGGNLTCRADEVVEDQLQLKPFVPDDLSGFEWKNSSTVYSVSRGDRLFRIMATRGVDDFQVNANFHTDLSGIKGRSERLEAAKAACKNFVEDRSTALSLIVRAFGVEIENDNIVPE